MKSCTARRLLWLFLLYTHKLSLGFLITPIKKGKRIEDLDPRIIFSSDWRGKKANSLTHANDRTDK
jgi:hypothetical protein